MPSWDDEEQEGSRPSSPTVAYVTRPNQFDDEEGEEEDVIDDWENDDSDAEREKEAKAKAAAEAEEKRAKEAAEARAAKGSRVDRMKLNTIRHQQEKELEGEESEEEPIDRAELIRREREADLAHADDLFGDLGASAKPKQAKKATIVSLAPTPTTTSGATASADGTAAKSGPSESVDLANLALFAPKTKAEFNALLAVVGPLLSASSSRKDYVPFIQDLAKEVCRSMNSEQVRKVVSTLTTLSNEKMKEEKGPAKKSKAAKTKVTLNSGGRNPTGASAKINDDTYDDDGDDDYFM